MRAKIILTMAAWATVGGLFAAARLKEIQFIQPQPAQQPGKATPAVASDPAEPGLGVRVSYTNSPDRMIRRLGGRVNNAAKKVVPAQADGKSVKVSTSARGTELTLETPGSYSDTAKLTFQSAPPMRFAMRLTKMPAMDLQSLSIASGDVTLRVGGVGVNETTKYFDKEGREVKAHERFAFTVKAKRVENGQVEVQVHRGAGAALGKTVSVSWQGNNYGDTIWLGGGMGGPAGIILER